MSENTLAAVVRAAAGNPAEPAPAAPVVHRVDASAEQIAAARAEGEAAGRAAERTRISGILTHEAAAGRETLARHLAFGSDMTVEAASGILANSAKEAPAPGSKLAAAMAGEPAPATAEGAAPPAPGARAAIDPSAIYASRREAVAKANGAAR